MPAGCPMSCRPPLRPSRAGSTTATRPRRFTRRDARSPRRSRRGSGRISWKFLLTARGPRSRRRPRPARRADVPPGLFELRKDGITGWWVATVVDRAFHRDRFARAAEPIDDGGDCQNCRLPNGDGVRVRTLKDFAFHLIGTEEDARDRAASVAQVSFGDARASGSWRTIVAPPGEHRPLHAVGSETILALLTEARAALGDARRVGQTEHLQLVQNWGAQAGARTNHLCLDLYDLPQIPHRIAEELGGAARFVIREGECPWCRLVRTEAMRPDRLVWQDA